MSTMTMIDKLGNLILYVLALIVGAYCVYALWAMTGPEYHPTATEAGLGANTEGLER